MPTRTPQQPAETLRDRHPTLASEQLIRAMDNINIRLGYTAPIRPKTAPWGLLAWYLHQIDPIADHPNYEGAFPGSNLEV